MPTKLYKRVLWLVARRSRGGLDHMPWIWAQPRRAARLVARMLAQARRQETWRHCALSSLLELMSSQIPMTCQDRGFRRSREGSQSRKEKRTPVQLLLALTILKIRNNSFIFVTFFSFQTKVSPLLRAALTGHFAVPCAEKCCNTLEQWIPYFGANFRCQFTITSGMYGNQFLLWYHLGEENKLELESRIFESLFQRRPRKAP